MTRLRTFFAAAAAAFLLLSAFQAKAGKAPSPTEDAIAAGAEIARENCSSCHAIGKTGASPNPQSPPFRTLSQRYPLDALGEALAEGIAVGHKDMPQFSFEPDEIDSLLAYLQELQPPKGK